MKAFLAYDHQEGEIGYVYNQDEADTKIAELEVALKSSKDLMMLRDAANRTEIAELEDKNAQLEDEVKWR